MAYDIEIVCFDLGDKVFIFVTWLLDDIAKPWSLSYSRWYTKHGVSYALI